MQAARQVKAKIAGRKFHGSTDYWKRRYAEGGNSGAGSYGEVATFKADVLNRYVAEQGISTVIEFGCGDGNQLALAKYPAYIGLDVSTDALRQCSGRFREDPTKSFYLYDPTVTVDHAGLLHADLALSLDVLLHLIEDDGFDAYMRALFAAGEQVVIFSSNEEIRDPAPHVRHRRFTDWVERNAPHRTLAEQIGNPLSGQGETHADFYVYR